MQMSEKLIDTIEAEDIYSDNMPQVIKNYLRDDCLEDGDILMYWKRAVKYIENYTGLDREGLQGKADVVQAMLAIIADMHDNRQYQGERSYINELVASVLGMYRRNLV